MPAPRTIRALACAALVLAACGGDGGSGGSANATPAPLSIVVLGDSIAFGEGINYGYTYDTSVPNHWTGGVPVDCN